MTAITNNMDNVLPLLGMSRMALQTYLLALQGS